MRSDNVSVERRVVKNARLRVRDSGAVELVVPARFTAAQVDDLLARKASWIAEKRRYFANRVRVKDRLAPNELRLFGKIFVFVETLELRTRTEVDHRGRQIRTGLNLADVEIRRRWCRRFARSYL